MAATVGQSTVDSTGSIVDTFDISFDPGAGSDMAVVGIHCAIRGGRNSESLVYDPGGDNIPMTSFAAIDGDAAVEARENRVYYLLDTDIVKSTTKTFRATTSDARHIIALLSLTDVNQITPLSGFQTAYHDAKGPTAQLAIVSGTDDIVCGWAHMGSLSENMVPSNSAAEWVPASMPLEQSDAFNASHKVGLAGTTDVGFEWDNSSRTVMWLGFTVEAIAAPAPGGIEILRRRIEAHA